MFRDHEEYDYSCKVCGRGYCADVGWSILPPCGCDESKILTKEEKLDKIPKRNKSLFDFDYHCHNDDDLENEEF